MREPTEQASTRTSRSAAAAGRQPHLPGLTIRSIVVASILSVVFVLWVRQVSLINHSCQVEEGVPAVPALTGLMLLSLIPVLLPRLRWLRMTRAEILCTYIIIYLAVPISGCNVMRQLLPSLMVTSYFASPENQYAAFDRAIPHWVRPTGTEIVRQFFEGNDSGGVPWAAWLVPMLVWALVFLALTMALFCLVVLFRRPWTNEERLTYPLAELAVELAPDGETGSGVHSLLRSPLFWTGCAVAAVFNITNMLNAFNPGVPALSRDYNLGPFLTDRPWSALQPLVLAFRPEIVGLGYLVSLDMLFSGWFFYLLLRFERFGTELIGLQVPGMPFDGPQGTGAYCALAVFLIWAARHHLKALWRDAVRGRRDPDRDDVLSPRAAIAGVVLGFGMMFVFCKAVGMTALASFWMVAGMGVTGLVYARIRAQTGLPMNYIVPRQDVTYSLFDAVGNRPILMGAGGHAGAALAFVNVIPRLLFPQSVAVQLEGLRMADLADIRKRHLVSAIFFALGLGLALGYWSHLTAYYHFGCNVLDGGTVEGGWRTKQSLMELDHLQAILKNPAATNWPSTIARGAGFGITAVLMLLRLRFLQFPVHPMGLAIAGTFGGQTWFPLFCAWILKRTVLHLGGPRAYKQLIPAFIGLAIGHYLIAGSFWALVGTFNEDAARRYMVWFT